MRVVLMAFLLVLDAGAARAADFSILPIPKHMSAWKFEDYQEALELVHKAAPGKLMVNLWDWQKLEPHEGKYGIKEELGGINYAIKEVGITPYAGVVVINTVKRVLPEDIDELSWDDPRMVTRYGQMLDEVKSQLSKPPAYFLIANEADVYLSEHPDEVPAFMKFAAAAKREVRARFPETIIGLSATYEGFKSGGKRAEIVRDLIGASDAAIYTYYPVFNLKPLPPEAIPAHLDEMIAAAGAKRVVLQEVGYPSAGKETSPAAQAAFFARAIPEIERRPAIAVAGLFALHDFDGKTCEGLTSYYGFDGLAGFAPATQDFKAFLCSLGLRDGEGNPKPAWDAVRQAFSRN